jgi:phage-related tail fiber protein
MPLLKGKQIQNASITKDKLNLVSPTLGNDPSTKDYVDTLVSQSISNQDWKSSCRVASTVNVSVSTAPSTIDGITLTINDRVLLKNQTTASQNGIYVFNGAGVAMTRSTDADSSSEVTSQLAVSIEEGTVNALTSWRLTNTGTITIGTTSLTFQLFFSVTSPVLRVSNKVMAASVTSVDFSLACSTALVSTPANGSYIIVSINGKTETLGDGVRTRDCYFSGDGGVTAKAISAIVAGDLLYWVGSVAGYQLDATDIVEFNYQA